MNLDIRGPIGLLFTILGLLLTGYGLIADSSIYQRSLGYNVNLSWGAVLLVFGIVMLMLNRRAANNARGGDRAIRPQEVK